MMVVSAGESGSLSKIVPLIIDEDKPMNESQAKKHLGLQDCDFIKNKINKNFTQGTQF